MVHPQARRRAHRGPRRGAEPVPRAGAAERRHAADRRPRRVRDRPARARGGRGAGGDDGEARVFDTPSALSAEGLTRIRDTAPDAAGSEVATDLVVYPEYAVLTWPDVEHPSREFRMTYRGGWDDRDDSPASPLPDPTFRIADIDPALVASVVRGAPETLGIPDPTSTYVIIDADEQGLPQYRVYVSNEVHLSGYLLVDHTGEPKSIHAP